MFDDMFAFIDSIFETPEDSLECPFLYYNQGINPLQDNVDMRIGLSLIGEKGRDKLFERLPPHF